MRLIFVNTNRLRPKLRDKINKYLSISPYNRLTVGVYKNGKAYVFGGEEENSLFYDIGSITKTFTAHLILKLHEEKILDIHKTVDSYLSLKRGKYPTIYQLLTHTAGYHHLTPIEVTLPRLITHGYARKNPYEKCTSKTVIKALERRRFVKPKARYGYSDFSSAVLAAVAEAVTKTPFSTLFENFINNDLDLKETHLTVDNTKRNLSAAKGRKTLPFWIWNKDNPYIASGGVVSNIGDLLKYLALQVESDEPYITNSHKVCDASQLKGDSHLACLGWHTYKNSNQLWHIGGAGTFRACVIANKRLKLGVAVLGNAKGKKKANIRYISNMIYKELKLNHINLEK